LVDVEKLHLPFDNDFGGKGEGFCKFQMERLEVFLAIYVFFFFLQAKSTKILGTFAWRIMTT
jgi:hypothetical protein